MFDYIQEYNCLQTTVPEIILVKGDKSIVLNKIQVAKRMLNESYEYFIFRHVSMNKASFEMLTTGSFDTIISIQVANIETGDKEDTIEKVKDYKVKLLSSEIECDDVETFKIVLYRER